MSTWPNRGGLRRPLRGAGRKETEQPSSHTSLPHRTQAINGYPMRHKPCGEMRRSVGGNTLYAPPAVHARSVRLMLHACSLAFTHPARGHDVRIESEAPF